MATKIADAYVSIRARMDKLDSDFATAKSRVSKKMTAMQGAIAARMGLIVSGALALGLGASIKAAGSQAEAEAVLESQIRATGGAAGFTADQLKRMASELQNVTTTGDEVQIQAMSVLLSFKQIQGVTFERTMKSANDLRVLMGSDLKSAILQLGKALEDPEAGLGALTRSGISFTAVEKDMIKSLAESGEMFEAQSIILDKIEGQLGGAAAAAANTFMGQLKQMKNVVGDVFETIGDQAGLILSPFVSMAKGLASAFIRINEVTGGLAAKLTLVTGAIVGLAVVGPRVVLFMVAFTLETIRMGKEVATVVSGSLRLLVDWFQNMSSVARTGVTTITTLASSVVTSAASMATATSGAAVADVAATSAAGAYNATSATKSVLMLRNARAMRIYTGAVTQNTLAIIGNINAVAGNSTALVVQSVSSARSAKGMLFLAGATHAGAAANKGFLASLIAMSAGLTATGWGAVIVGVGVAIGVAVVLISKLASGFSAAWTEASKGGDTGFTLLVRAIKQVWKGVKSVASTIQSSMAPAMDRIGVMGEAIFGAINTFLLDNGDAFIEWGKAIGSIVESLAGWVVSVFEIVAGLIGGIFDIAGGLINIMTGGMIKDVRGLVSVFMWMVAFLLKGIAVILSAWKALWKEMAKIVEVVMSVIQPSLDLIGSVLSEGSLESGEKKIYDRETASIKRKHDALRDFNNENARRLAIKLGKDTDSEKTDVLSSDASGGFVAIDQFWKGMQESLLNEGDDAMVRKQAADTAEVATNTRKTAEAVEVIANVNRVPLLRQSVTIFEI